MMFSILLIMAIGFVIYAVATHYKDTDASKSIPKRVWASVVAAGAAIGAMVMAWFQS